MSKRKHLSRRDFLRMGALTAAGAALAGCAPQVVTKEVTKEIEKRVEVTPTPHPAIQGELTIDMQYIPGKATADTPKPLFEVLRIAEEYKKEHPGVDIKFVEPFKPTEAMNQATYFKTGAAAGTLPDISFTYGLSFIYDKDTILPTTEFLEEANEYIPLGKPGHKRWIDQWFEDVRPEKLPDGNTYSIPVGWGGPGPTIGYNKEMWDEAGISEIPDTYYDYYHICEQLLDSGVVPCESMLMSWEWDRMVDYLLKAMDLFKLIDIDGSGECNVKEETRAAVAGIVRLDAPYWVEPTRIWKTATNYFQPGYLQLAQTTAAIGVGEIFMTEEAAMLWGPGSIWSRLMMDLGGSSKWGVFHYPKLTSKLTPFATDDPKRGIGRGTASKTITKTCEERGHVRMAVDFLKFLTTPTNSARMIEERLGTELVLPSIKGLEDVALSKDVKKLMKDYEEPTGQYGFQSDRIGDWHFWYEWFSAIQAYFAGDKTLKEMIEYQQDALPEFLNNAIENKGWEEEAKEWKALREDEYTPPPWGEYEIPSEPFVMPFNR